MPMKTEYKTLVFRQSIKVKGKFCPAVITAGAQHSMAYTLSECYTFNKVHTFYSIFYFNKFY